LNLPNLVCCHFTRTEWIPTSAETIPQLMYNSTTSGRPNVRKNARLNFFASYEHTNIFEGTADNGKSYRILGFIDSDIGNSADST
jgi:hypothetical protein